MVSDEEKPKKQTKTKAKEKKVDEISNQNPQPTLEPETSISSLPNTPVFDRDIKEEISTSELSKIGIKQVWDFFTLGTSVRRRKTKN